MNRLIKRIKRIQLVYENKKIEEEYCSHQEPSNTQSSKFALYFIIFLLQVPAIPALINHHYLDAGIAALLGVLLFLIHFCKAFPKQYFQSFLGIIVCSFNCCSLLYPSTSIKTASKGDMFLQGYGVASINVIFLVQLTTLTQKIVFLAYCYAFRFTLIFLLDSSTEQILAVISHLYIDLFVVFVSILNSKNKRLIFKKYYETQEDLDGIKDFLSNCFPHSFAVLDANAEKLLYTNKTFSQTFLDMENESPLQLQSHLGLLSPGSKPMLKSLKVDISTIREVGDQFLTLDFAKQVELFENVLEKLNRHAILNKKAVSFSASYTSQDEQKSVEIILTKIKWNTQEAVVAIFNDTTYQQDIIRLKMQNAYKDRTISTVSHELRTPLNGILGILGLVEARIEDKQTLEYLELCKDNSNLLLSLVNSILDLHQIREGKLRTDPVALEVRKVLESVRKLFMFQCSQKGIELKLNISDGAPRYMCTDENRLKQILINLIGNSIKFTSQGGVTVEVDQDPNNEEYLQISVSDTGIGIKEEDKNKLFQMYEKIEHGRNVNKNGVGLGLTIANTLAGILGGKKEGQMIEVESQVNKGSKFSFKILKDLEQLSERNENSMTKILKNCGKDSIEELNSQEEFYETPQIRKRTIGRLKSKINIPIQTETNSFISRLGSILMIDKTKSSNLLAATCNSSEPLETQKYPLNRVKTSRKILHIEDRGCILAVDDNPFNLLVIHTMAQEIGCTLKMAQSGQEAIEIIRLRNKDDQPFKVILMDCQMPMMDGFETTRKLRDMMENSEVQNVPIIALTANTAEEDIRRCYEVGMVDHLSKPLDVNALHKAISGLVK